MARMAAARSSFDILLIVAFAFALATAADALVSATASKPAAFAGGAVAFGDGDVEELANTATAFEGGVEAIAFAVGGEPTFVAALCFLAGEGVAPPHPEHDRSRDKQSSLAAALPLPSHVPGPRHALWS